MKYVRFMKNGEIRYGILSGDRINVLQGNYFQHSSPTDLVVGLTEIKLLSPCSPTKAVCVGLNYRDHAEEMKLDLPKEPLLFLKPSSALNDPGGEIVYPAISNSLHYEAELAVVIGKTAKHIKAAQAYENIFGYCCANDVTARAIPSAELISSTFPYASTLRQSLSTR